MKLNEEQLGRLVDRIVRENEWTEVLGYDERLRDIVVSYIMREYGEQGFEIQEDLVSTVVTVLVSVEIGA